MKNQKAIDGNENVVIVLTSASNEEIHVTFSSVVKVGWLTLRRLDGSIIFQKVISNTNYAHVAIPKDSEKLLVSVDSDSIHYQKILTV